MPQQRAVWQSFTGGMPTRDGRARSGRRLALLALLALAVRPRLDKRADDAEAPACSGRLVGAREPWRRVRESFTYVRMYVQYIHVYMHVAKRE